MTYSQTLLFSNNAATTLATNISSVATTVNLAAGAGALFPNPTTGQAFTLTMLDAGTQTKTEVMLCTAKSGDTLTVVRGQEGTTAQSWLAGDYAKNVLTAGTAQSFAQSVLLPLTYALLGGSSSQTFLVANSTSGTSEAVPRSQADSLYQPAGSYAALAGNSSQQFNVANATTPTEAVALGQLLAQNLALSQSPGSQSSFVIPFNNGGSIFNLVIKFGVTPTFTSLSNQTITFTTPFPTGGLIAQATANALLGFASNDQTFGIGGLAANDVVISATQYGAGAWVNMSAFWIAFGW